MKNKNQKRRIYLLEVNGINIELSHKISEKDIKLFLDHNSYENLVKSKLIKKINETSIHKRMDNLTIHEERDAKINNSGSSKLIEDYGSLEKYMQFLNNNPEYINMNILESYNFFNLNKDEFIKYNHFVPFPKDYFLKFIKALLKEQPNFFNNQDDFFYFNSSFDFIEAMDELKIKPNFNFFNISFGEEKNKYGFLITFSQFKWLFNKGVKVINKKNKEIVIKNLELLIKRDDKSRIVFLLESGLIKKELINSVIDLLGNNFINSSHNLIKNYL